MSNEQILTLVTSLRFLREWYARFSLTFALNAVLLPCSAMQEYHQGSFVKPSEVSGSSGSISRHAAGSQSNSDGIDYHGPAGSDPYLSSPNAFGMSPSNSNGIAYLGGSIRKLFKKPSQEGSFGYTGVGGLPSQRIVGTGVEALMGRTAGTLQVSVGSTAPHQEPFPMLTAGPDDGVQEPVFETCGA